ncbi:MAG: hypothetical protein QM669_15735, partial [Siphonobacter sp.]
MTLTLKNLANLTGIHILLVDDNPFKIQIVQHKIRAIISLAERYLEVVIQGKEGHHNAVLMNLQLPDLDDYIASNQIRELDQKAINLLMSGDPVSRAIAVVWIISGYIRNRVVRKILSY